jgi:hypothetical protein
MKLYIQTIGEIVTAMQLSAEPLGGWIETSLTEYPNITFQDGCTTEVMWDGKTLSVVQVPIPQPTQEEISQMRQSAYEAECDPYLVAYQGYLVEGDTAKAESARKAYLKAKAEVRKRLPYAE